MFARGEAIQEYRVSCLSQDAAVLQELPSKVICPACPQICTNGTVYKWEIYACTGLE